jgi:hypothetical protein
MAREECKGKKVLIPSPPSRFSRDNLFYESLRIDKRYDMA